MVVLRGRGVGGWKVGGYETVVNLEGDDGCILVCECICYHRAIYLKWHILCMSWHNFLRKAGFIIKKDYNSDS